MYKIIGIPNHPSPLHYGANRGLCSRSLLVTLSQPNTRPKEEDELKPGLIYMEDVPKQIRKTGMQKNKKSDESEIKSNNKCLVSYKTKRIRISRPMRDEIKGKDKSTKL